MKRCRRCSIEKELSLYYKHKYHKDGHEQICKECRSCQTKKFRKNDPTYRERHNLQAKKYRKDNKEKVKESKKLYYINNSESVKQYMKKYFSVEENKKRKIKNNIRRRDERIQYDPTFSFICIVKEFIRNSFKRGANSKNGLKTKEILGCTFEEFKLHLESKFESWMTWENRGRYNGDFNFGWDIDHIVPISSAENIDEVIKLNHYTNLQPLCSKVNRDIKKNNIV